MSLNIRKLDSLLLDSKQLIALLKDVNLYVDTNEDSSSMVYALELLVLPCVKTFFKEEKIASASANIDLINYSSLIVKKLMKYHEQERLQAQLQGIDESQILKTLNVDFLDFLKNYWEVAYVAYSKYKSIESNVHKDLPPSFEGVKNIFVSVLSIAATNEAVVKWILSIEFEAKLGWLTSILYLESIKCCLERNLSYEIECLIFKKLSSSLYSNDSKSLESHTFSQSTIIKKLTEMYNQWKLNKEYPEVKDAEHNTKFMDFGSDYGKDLQIQAELTILKTFAVILSENEKSKKNNSNTVIQSLDTLFNDQLSPENYKFYLNDENLKPSWTNIFNFNSIRSSEKAKVIVSNDQSATLIKLERGFQLSSGVCKSGNTGAITDNMVPLPTVPSPKIEFQSKPHSVAESFDEAIAPNTKQNHVGQKRHRMHWSRTNDSNYNKNLDTFLDDLKNRKYLLKDWFWSFWYPVDDIATSENSVEL